MILSDSADGLAYFRNCDGDKPATDMGGIMKQAFVIVSLCSLIFTSCGKEEKAEQPASSKSVFESKIENVSLDGTEVILAGVIFAPPAAWTDHGPSGMRKAEYSFGPVDQDIEAASVTVFYFGLQQGGTAADNIDRWESQMKTTDGSSVSWASLKSEFTVDGMKVSTVEVSGTYMASMGGPMSADKVDKENYRLLAAVVQGSQGNLFFKLTGPDKSAAAMTEGFVAMIRALRKADDATG